MSTVYPDPDEIVTINVGRMSLGVRVLTEREHRRAMRLYEEYLDTETSRTVEIAAAKADELATLFFGPSDATNESMLDRLSTRQYWDAIRQAIRVQTLGKDAEGKSESPPPGSGGGSAGSATAGSA